MSPFIIAEYNDILLLYSIECYFDRIVFQLEIIL